MRHPRTVLAVTRSTTRLPTALTATLAGALALTMTNVPAAAQPRDPTPSQRTVVDRRGDVVEYGNEDSWVVPKRHLGDLARIRVTHRRDGIMVRARVRALRREGDDLQFYFDINTPKAAFGVLIFVEFGNWKGQHALETIENPAPVRCPGLWHRLGYRDNIVVLFIPRTCLNRPRWVNATVRSWWVYSSTNRFRSYNDEAWVLRRTFSPWAR